MKKNILLHFFALFLFCQAAYSQSWIWSKETYPPSPARTNGMVRDNSGNVYTYGSYFIYDIFTYDPSTDTTGSFIQAYSPSGTMLFSKEWKMPFHIHKMDYDGGNYFYFAATFFGTQVIDGITITSEGLGDGLIGKMDLSGTIIWMKTFGGSGIDAALGASFNVFDGTVYVCGNIAHSLYFNNVYTSDQQQSAIVAHYSTSGTLLNHKEYDFIPQRDLALSNIAAEVTGDMNGNIFMLMDRDGADWSGPDSVVAPMVGRYIFKLTNTLDTIWSTYIIGPSCYYGWDAKSLHTSSNGDVYISSTCYGHYGGDAVIDRLNGTTGNITWSLANNDGDYPDLYVDGSTLYVIGTEDANACPCPGATPGHQALKVFDQANVLLGETRATSQAHFGFVTKDLSGNIYITGEHYASTIALGPDSVTSGSGVFGGHFLSKLNSTYCNAPTVISSLPADMYTYDVYTICPGDSIGLTSDLSQGTFNWSDGQTGQQIYAGSTASYSVVNTQPNGCIAYSLPVTVKINQNVNSHRICVVTYDTASHKNLVVIKENNDDSYDVTQKYLYKDVSGTMTLIGTFSGPSGVAALDSTSDPDVSSVDYYVSTTDSCGSQSGLSPFHRTIHLTVSQDVTTRNVLNWNADPGSTTFIKYRIWRGTSPANLVLFDSVSISSTSYTDNTLPSAGYYYEVEARKPGADCTFNSIHYGMSLSNISTFSMAADIASSSLINSILISPNPTQQSFHVNYKATKQTSLTMTLRNTLGEVIFSEDQQRFSGEYTKEVDLSQQPKGIYFLEVVAENKTISKKVVKQ